MLWRRRRCKLRLYEELCLIDVFAFGHEALL